MIGTHETGSEAATEALGAGLWKSLRTPDCVLLDAPMGTGKTALARGLVRAAGHVGEVPSPTYALVQPYETTPPLYHLDLYRVNSQAELTELGLDDMLDHGVVVAEWPERPGWSDWWPEDALRVAGTILPGGARRWVVSRGTG